MSNVKFSTFKTSATNDAVEKAYEAAKEQYVYKATIKAGINASSVEGRKAMVPAGVEVVALSNSRAAAMKPETVAILKDGSPVEVLAVGSRKEALQRVNASIQVLWVNQEKEKEMAYEFEVQNVPTMVQIIKPVKAGKNPTQDELNAMKEWARTICKTPAGKELPIVGKVEANIRRPSKGSVRVVAKRGTLVTAMINSPLGRETVARHGFVSYPSGFASVTSSMEVLIDWLIGIGTEGVKLVDALSRKPGGVVIVKTKKPAPKDVFVQQGDMDNISPDTSHKLAAPVGNAWFVARKLANSMAAVNHPTEKGKYLSVYDVKKATPRMILNPDLETKVSIGVRKVAVLISVTNEAGDKVKALADVKGHPLAINLAGGACYARKALIQQYGKMRVVSYHHIKGVVANVRQVDALIDYLGVDIISPMLKSKSVGVAHALMGGDIDQFLLRLKEDKDFRATANTAIIMNSKVINVDGLVYTFAIINEEVYVSDFYTLQGHRRVGEEITINDKINGVETKAPEMTLMAELLSELKGGDTTYSPVIRLLEMKRAGLVEPVAHSAEGGVLLADQMIRQYGESLFRSFANGRTGRKTAKAAAAAKSVDYSWTANELLTMTRTWWADRFAVMFAGNGSLSVEQVKYTALMDGEKPAEAMKVFLTNLFNGHGKFPGLLNMPRGFEVVAGDFSFVFPGSSYWDKPEVISGDKESGLQFTGGDFFKSLSSVLLMAKNRGTKTWAAMEAKKTHSKHLLAIEETFGAHRGLKFSLPKGRSLPVSYHFEGGFKIITADRSYKEAAKKGEVGAIKFPILMENNFRLYQTEVKTLMAFESEAELELNRFICESIVFVDALSHMANRDDADGDRLTLFWAKGYGEEEKWSESKLLACNSAKQQLSYVESELSSLNTKEVDEKSIQVWDKADVQPAVEEIVSAKTGIGSEVNNLITMTHLIRNKLRYSDVANLAIDAMGILIQKEVVENMKHDNGRVRLCEYLNLTNEDTDLDSISEAFEKAFELMGICDDQLAYDIAKVFIGLFEENKRSKDKPGYRWDATNVVRVAHTATWRNIHKSVYSGDEDDIYRTSMFSFLDEQETMKCLTEREGRSPVSFLLMALCREAIEQRQVLAEVKAAEAEALANGETVEVESCHEVDMDEAIDML